MVVGSGCPRATLKWLLSLYLSLPIKQVRRDFSNGFLFAELFAKFFPSDVSLHSYNTGSSLARKKDNWRLLQKVFKVRCVCACVYFVFHHDDSPYFTASGLSDLASSLFLCPLASKWNSRTNVSLVINVGVVVVAHRLRLLSLSRSPPSRVVWSKMDSDTTLF